MIKSQTNQVKELEKTFKVGSIYILKDTLLDNGEELYEGTPVIVREVCNGTLVVEDYRGISHIVKASIVCTKEREKLSVWQNFLLKHESFFENPLFSRFAASTLILGLMGFFLGLFASCLTTLETIAESVFVGSSVLLFVGLLCILLTGEDVFQNAHELDMLLKTKNH